MNRLLQPVWSCSRFFTLLVAVICILPSSTVAFVMPHHPTRRTTTMFSTDVSPSSLETMTVKELHLMLEESNLNERGLKSKLKRKQDLVEYLKEHLPQNQELHHQEPDGVTNRDTSDEQQASPSHETPDKTSEPPVVHVELPKDFENLPAPLQDGLVRREISSLMPIQKAAYNHILSGNDAVLHAPTGQGKTWAFCLPLAARILTDPKLQARAKGKHSSERFVAVSPCILTLVPSRELARQVGREWAKWSTAPVATVFGGVPLERHVNLLRKGGGAHVVVSTPGRWRELVREGHVDYKQLQVLVLDEADTMLDAADSPDVTAILKQIDDAVGQRVEEEDQQYQMILVSATVNALVRSFALDTMEILPHSNSFITVEHQEFPNAAPASGSSSSATKSSAPVVEHWYTPVKTFVQPSVTADLIQSLAPRLCLVFVPTKSDTESVASFLSQRLSGSTLVRTLQGDMTQAQRSRTIALIRNTVGAQVLVATDVASRGLDLPHVDLVVQCGVPRLAGKEGTFNVELYTHRTGRAGRAGSTTSGGGGDSANAIMLYDPAIGEGKVLDDLSSDVEYSLGVTMKHRPIPSSLTMVEAAYDRTVPYVLHHEDDDGTAKTHPDLVSYFQTRLQQDLKNGDASDPEILLQHLAVAMARLANVDTNNNVSPYEPHCSLLTGDVKDCTLVVTRINTNDDDAVMTPTMVTQFCKSLKSGKLGRVIVTDDNTALLDLSRNKAKLVLEEFSKSIQDENERAQFEVAMATTVPDHYMITGRRKPEQ